MIDMVKKLAWGLFLIWIGLWVIMLSWPVLFFILSIGAAAIVITFFIQFFTSDVDEYEKMKKKKGK